uniref:RNA polymerase sigma factor n=1 Tax=uncultured Draconibacterium sp. TaxID=1573823 RepID=UPI0032172705
MGQTDQEYWALFKEGDQEALGKIFETYFNELYFYGLKIVPVADLVKDIIQEMFVYIWDNRDKVGDVKRVKSYLLVTLRNELIHALKKNRYAALDFESASEPFTLTAEDFFINNEDEKALNSRLLASLNSLSERQREIILLRFYHNIGFEELAEVMEMNVQSVRNLLFRALGNIRKDLKDFGFHNPDNIEIILFTFFSKKI